MLIAQTSKLMNHVDCLITREWGKTEYGGPTPKCLKNIIWR